MKLCDVPTPELRRILRATERDAGPDSAEARVMRRELAKREYKHRQARLSRRKGGRGGAGPPPPAGVWVSPPLPSNSVVAITNYWGDPSGPNPPPDYNNPSGALISERVTYNPWLTSEPPGVGP